MPVCVSRWNLHIHFDLFFLHETVSVKGVWKSNKNCIKMPGFKSSDESWCNYTGTQCYHQALRNRLCKWAALGSFLPFDNPITGTIPRVNAYLCLEFSGMLSTECYFSIQIEKKHISVAKTGHSQTLKRNSGFWKRQQDKKNTSVDFLAFCPFGANNVGNLSVFFLPVII